MAAKDEDQFSTVTNLSLFVLLAAWLPVIAWFLFVSHASTAGDRLWLLTAVCASAGLLVAGCVLYVGGTIVEEIRRKR